jgi:hypothetical protein
MTASHAPRFNFVDGARVDVRGAWRTLSRTPAFSLVAILTLALGIGATTAVFSVVNAVLLRPLPYKDSVRLVRILEQVPATDGSAAPSETPGRDLVVVLSYASWQRYFAGARGSSLSA